MAERVSPLASAPAGRAAPDAGVALSTRADLTLHQVTAWPEAAAAVAKSLAPAAVRTGPLTWWLIDRPVPALAPESATVLDLSCAWTPIRVAGPQAAALLSRIVAIDLRDAAFPPGAFAMTGDAHGALALRRMDLSEYEIYVARSFAHALWDRMMIHAPQFGLATA